MSLLPRCRHSFVSCRAKSLPPLNQQSSTKIYVNTAEQSDERSVFRTNNLMHLYVKRGSIMDARHVFDIMRKRDVVSWNIMILGYANQEEGALALELYSCMHKEGIHPTDRTFVGTLKACTSLAAHKEENQGERKLDKISCLAKGRAIHSQVLRSGFESDVFVGTTLVNMYAKCGGMEDARRVFDELPHRDAVTWNTMILGYAEQEDSSLAFELYGQIHHEGVTADHRTFVGALKACNSLAALEEAKQVDGKLIKIGCLMKGRAIYSLVVKSGFESDAFVLNSLVIMYAKCGSIEDARHVFDRLLHPDLVRWNTMILGYVEQEENEEAFQLYAQMLKQGLLPSSGTFVAVLKACGHKAALRTGKELHSQISRVGFDTILIVVTSLIDMYAKCGSMVDAQQLFNTLPARDVVPWGALIAGYARQGASELVFYLFETMSREGIQPNEFTFLSVLIACCHAGLVDNGQKYFHAMSKQYGIKPTIEHYTCMVDLIGRAGQVDEAVKMVDRMPFQPDVVVWSSVLDACRKWNNVNVGRHAFENVIKLNAKVPAAYVLMASIYADSHMWEDCDKIQGMRKNEALRKTSRVVLD